MRDHGIGASMRGQIKGQYMNWAWLRAKEMRSHVLCRSMTGRVLLTLGFGDCGVIRSFADFGIYKGSFICWGIDEMGHLYKSYSEISMGWDISLAQGSNFHGAFRKYGMFSQHTLRQKYLGDMQRVRDKSRDRQSLKTSYPVIVPISEGKHLNSPL